tara:strand:- start:160 stop:291 length:132 start_codon:yes stop_codon:yes gene_type:complete
MMVVIQMDLQLSHQVHEVVVAVVEPELQHQIQVDLLDQLVVMV